MSIGVGVAGLIVSGLIGPLIESMAWHRWWGENGQPGDGQLQDEWNVGNPEERLDQNEQEDGERDTSA